MFTSLLLPFHCSATFQTWLERSLSRLVKQPFWSSCYAMRQLIVCQAYRLVCVKSIDSAVSIQRSWRFSSKSLIRPLTFNWLTLTSEIHLVKFIPEVASCLLSRGKRKYAPLGMRLLWKHIRNYFSGIPMNFTFLSYLQNYKEFEAEILDLQLEKYWYQKKKVLLPV